MPLIESSAVTVIPAALNFFVKSVQTGFEFTEAPIQISDLRRSIEDVQSDIRSAKLMRVQLAKVSGPNDLVDLDQAIQAVESALSGLEELVEPARVHMDLNNGQVGAWKRLMWVVKHSNNVLATNTRLIIAQARFNQQVLLSSLGSRIRQENGHQPGCQCNGGYEAPPPPYLAHQETLKQAMAERRQSDRRRRGALRATQSISVHRVSSAPDTPTSAPADRCLISEPQITRRHSSGSNFSSGGHISPLQIVNEAYTQPVPNSHQNSSQYPSAPYLGDHSVNLANGENPFAMGPSQLAPAAGGHNSYTQAPQPNVIYTAPTFQVPGPVTGLDERIPVVGATHFGPPQTSPHVHQTPLPVASELDSTPVVPSAYIVRDQMPTNLEERIQPDMFDTLPVSTVSYRVPQIRTPGVAGAYDHGDFSSQSQDFYSTPVRISSAPPGAPVNDTEIQQPPRPSSIAPIPVQQRSASVPRQTVIDQETNLNSSSISSRSVPQAQQERIMSPPPAYSPSVSIANPPREQSAVRGACSMQGVDLVQRFETPRDIRRHSGTQLGDLNAEVCSGNQSSTDYTGSVPGAFPNSQSPFQFLDGDSGIASSSRSIPGHRRTYQLRWEEPTGNDRISSAPTPAPIATFQGIPETPNNDDDDNSENIDTTTVVQDPTTSNLNRTRTRRPVRAHQHNVGVTPTSSRPQSAVGTTGGARARTRQEWQVDQIERRIGRIDLDD